MNSAQIIPPKMLAQLVERARRGDYDRKIGTNIYEWYVGRNRMTVIGLDYPTGTLSRMSVAEMKDAEAKKLVKAGA